MKNKAWRDEIKGKKISCLSGDFIWPMRKPKNSFIAIDTYQIYQAMSKNNNRYHS